MSLGMCDTHIAKTALLSVVAALVAIHFVVVTYRSVTIPNIQRARFPLGGRLEPKPIGYVDWSQPAGQRVNVSYMEQQREPKPIGYVDWSQPAGHRVNVSYIRRLHL